MAQEVGVAYVALLPSAKGFGKAVEGEIDGAVSAGEKKAGGFFGTVAKGAALAVGAAVTAVGAITLGKGISRALNIEDAQAKLKGLGHDAQAIEAIMTDALASVRGTAFGLDTAATVAATAVAAGIKPGQELERYLRLTADAATIAGVSMEEMGGILNKATTAGKVYTQELNQLADRGLPIFQWLQEEYGVTAEELRKMVERGEVDAATFRKVIEDNIGGAALASGDTTRGAFANVMAALGRLGAMFAGPGLGLAKTLFQELTVVIDVVAEKLKPLAAAFSSLTGGLDLEGMGERFRALVEGVDIGALVTSFTNARGSMIEAGVQLIGGLIEGAIQAIPQIVSSFAALVSQIVVLINSQGPTLIAGAVTLFLGLVTGLMQVLPQVVSTLIGLVPTITVALLAAVPQLITGAITLFQGIVQAIATVLPQIITALVGLLPMIVTSLVNLIPMLIDGAIQLFMALVQAIPVIIPLLVQGIVDLLPVLITTVLSLIPALLDGAIELLLAIVRAIPVIIPALIDGIISLLPVLITTIIGLIPQLIQTAITLFTALVDAIPRVIPALVDAVIKVGPKIVDAIIKMIPMIFDAGVALIQGLIDGIGSMFGAIGDAVGGVMDFIGGFFPHSPAKWGPFSGSGWTAVADGGRSLMEQFADGMKLEAAGVEGAFDHMVHVPDASLSGASSTGDFYVQNPFTGEYLLAEVSSVASGVSSATTSNFVSSFRGGKRP